MASTDCSCHESQESPPRRDRGAPAEARAVLRDVLRREIKAARRALEAVQRGEQTDEQIPYVNRAAHVLTDATGKVKLMITCSTASGNDKTLDAEVSLADESSQEKALTTRIALYLLVTRGRLRKIIKKNQLENLNIGPYISTSERFEMKREKIEYLEKNAELHKASSVKRLYCSYDREWSARFLQVVAPRLERISVSNIGIAHLQILELMPRLRNIKFRGVNDDFGWNDNGPFYWNDEGRFKLESNDPQDTTRPFWLRELPTASSVGLMSISVDLPRQLLLPLIVQHRATLRELSLTVDLPHSKDDILYDWQRRWSWCCHDLPQRLAELLERFPLPALRLLKLFRGSSHSEEQHAVCGRQLRAVRRVLGPRVTVLCCMCG